MTDIPKIRKAPSYIDPHLLHRKAQEKKHFSNETTKGPMASLLTIELNISELCNRTCVFCPRVDPEIYPNRNLNMEPELISRLIDEVERMELLCRFSFSGFGEPLLHKGFSEMIRQIRDRLPDNIIEVNTSGDQLDSSIIKHLFRSGLTYLYINLFDGPEQRSHFEKMIAKADIPDERWKLRPHWVGADADFALTLNNRSGMVNSPESGIGPLEQALKIRCHYPFYKMLLDWNGDVLFCSNDWGREIVIGNLHKKSLDQLWMDPRMLTVRRKLMNESRNFSPCDKCSVHGTLSGAPSFARLIRHYFESGEIAADEIPSDLRDKLEI